MPIIPCEHTILSIEAATPGTWTEMAQVTSIGAANLTVAPVKTTFITSQYQTYRPGLIPDPGQFTVTCWYDPNLAPHQDLYEAQANGETINFKMEYNDGLTTPAAVTFAGFIVTIEEGAKEDENNVSMVLTLQVSGKPTRTAGTP